MRKIEYTKLQQENLKNLNKLMDLRVSQIKEFSKEHWYEELLRDELWLHLCKKLAEIKSIAIYPEIKITEEDIKNLASHFITPEEYVFKNI